MSTRLTIEDMDILAKNAGLKCISEKYTNNHTKLRWECKLKHRWSATPNNIKNGTRCPMCFFDSRKLTMKDMNILAKDKGFRCISQVYTNSNTKLEWECPLRHRWFAVYSSIKQGTRCPKCSNFKHISQEKCRFIIEQLTGYEFSTTKKILRNGQEIDGFSETLKIGFEYQGEQHYKFIRGWHKTKDKFKQIQRLDKKKKARIRRFKKLGKIKDIIFIKYTQAQSGSDEKLIHYIIKQLNKIDSSLIKKDRINWSSFYRYLSPLNKIREIAAERGGKLTSDYYINANTKVVIDCGKGHTFGITPSHLKSGKWCPYCAKKKKHTLKQMQELAKQNNCTCESDIYTNNDTKLKWRCNVCSNIFEKSYGNIIHHQCKYFCKKCKNLTKFGYS